MKPYFWIMKMVCWVAGMLIIHVVTGQVDSVEFAADYQASLALYEESKLLIAEGKYLEAVDFLSQAHEFYKGNSDYTYAAAFALYKIDSLRAAERKIGWSLSLEPFQSDYHVMAGNIFYKQMAYRRAINSYTQALQYQDSSQVVIDDLSCTYNRGNCYLQLELFQEAERDYSYVIDIDQSNYMAYHNRAQARLRSGRKEEACQDFQSAVDAGSRVSAEYMMKYCY